jgi:deazaflavin-dependent oxidoreductase (nitroreductase family)
MHETARRHGIPDKDRARITMSELNSWNQQVIAEFRANEGRVGGSFTGAPMVLVHYVGRKSGREYVTPLVYLPKDGDDNSIYIFASKGGAPTHPDWYHNLVQAGQTTIEVGASTYPVTVTELSGGERDRVYAAQVQRMPVFGEYATRADGIRTIPVLELTRK